ncbi:MAG: ABC transporter permease [bacterium]
MTTPDRESELRDLVRPPVGERVDRELEFHIEMRTRELVERGMSPTEARADAIRRFGNFEEVSSTLVEIAGQTEGIMRRARFVREAARDARVALRMLMRRRAFAALAIGTLALGIGAATAIYSVVDGVLLRPLPFSEPDRIAAVWITQPSLSKDPAIAWLADRTPMGNNEYQALRRDAASLRDLAMYADGGPVTLTTEAGSERLPTMLATSSLLRALRVHPAVGRAFVDGEDVLNGPNVAMLSWDTWRSRFGGDSSVVGRKLTLDDKPYEIIGVLPQGLQVDRATDAPAFWLPALHDSTDIPAKRNRGYRALARLAPGVPYSAATDEVARVLREVTGDTLISARVEEWQRDQTHTARGPLLLLLAAAGLLLLIACVNVAILQLAEAAARSREMATRAALGAGVARLVRQLLAESVVISFLGALIGTALAWLMIRGLVALSPERLPGMDDVALDGRVLAFTMACAAGTGVLFGIVPALLAGRSGAAAIIRSGAGESGRGARTVQRSLVAIQLALSMALLVEATLLAQSLRNLSKVDPGFQRNDLAAVRVMLPREFSTEQRLSFTSNMLQRLRAYPGVARATVSTHVPFVSGVNSSPVTVDHSEAAAAAARQTQQRYVEPGYFELLGMHLLSGRFFTPDDRDGGELVAVVSAAEVARDFGGVSPLGREVRHQGKWRRIVGVVADVKYRGLAREDEATIYVPYGQLPGSWPYFIIRGSAAAVMPAALTAMVHEVEPRAIMGPVTAIPGAIEKSYAAERFRAVLVSVFGGMAALLAVVGLYGVSIRTTKRRMREIGIRLALGGSRGSVVRLLVNDAMAGVAMGLAVGAPVALLAGRLVSPYLFGISPRDPIVFAGVAVSLAIATALASGIPARSAGRMNPAEVLRAD